MILIYIVYIKAKNISKGRTRRSKSKNAPFRHGLVVGLEIFILEVSSSMSFINENKKFASIA